METNNLTLRPIEFVCWGSGDPVKSDPFKHASRKFSQNVIYLCKDRARSAKDISTLLGVPMPFVEEELEIQCSGSNGNDGLLKKLDNGKYISTFVMLDYEDYLEIKKYLTPHLDGFTDRIQTYVEKNKRKILALPFLSKQDDIRFILWSMIHDMTQGISKNLCRIILDKYYAGVQSDVKDYYPFAFVINPDRECRIRGGGCDSVHGSNICGYSNIFIQNIYDHFRIESHFHCGLNLAATPYIQLTIRSIAKGLKIKNLTPGEQEAASTALEHGFVRKEGGTLFPNILVLRNGDHRAFNAIAENFSSEVMDLANEIAAGFHERVVKYLPEHLAGEAERLVGHAVGEFASDVIDKCIERGVLYKPEKRLTAEGTLMIVQK